MVESEQNEDRAEALADGDLYRFEGHELDTAARTLIRDGETIHVSPRVFLLLEHLVRNAGRGLRREELLDTVWEGVVVSDHSLTEAVSRLRRALGDDPRSPRFVKTIPAYGLRFVAPVEVVERDGPSAPITRWPPLWQLALPGAVLSGLIVVVTLAAGLLQAGSRPVERVTMAELTLPDGVAIRDWSAELSPSGDRLAFVRSEPPQLMTIDLATDQTRVVADLERIWTYRQIRWSPDATSLAYSDRPEFEGPGVIDLFDLDSGERRRMLSRDAGPVSVLGWDASGEQLLAHASGEDGPELMLLDQSGDVRGLWAAGPLSEGRTSPDGRWLAVSAYAVGGPEEIAVIPVEKLWSDPASVPADAMRDWAGAPRILEPPIDDEGPRWSPDSRRLLFFSMQGGDRSLWTVALEEGAPVGRPRPIEVPGSPYHVQGWTEDGQIFFSRYHTDTDVALLPLVPGAAKPAGEPVLLSVVDGRAGDAVWSGDPHRVMYRSSHEDRAEGDLYVAALDPETGYPERGRRRVPIEGRFLAPAWSVDGSRVTFSMRLEGGGWGLFEHEIASGTQRRLLPEVTLAGFASLSSDRTGRYLLFNAGPKHPLAPAELTTLAPGRYLLDRERETYRLVDELGNTSASLSPDAAWAVASTGSALERFELDGDGRRQVVAEAPDGWTIPSSVAVSRDGEWIAYIVERRLPESLCEDSQLWIVDAAGQDPRHVREADDWSPSAVSWSPDGAQLAIKSWVCRDGVMRFVPPPSAP